MLLDGIDSTSFLRSDAADIKTSGDLTFSDDVKASSVLTFRRVDFPQL